MLQKISNFQALLQVRSTTHDIILQTTLGAGRIVNHSRKSVHPRTKNYTYDKLFCSRQELRRKSKKIKLLLKGYLVAIKLKAQGLKRDQRISVLNCT